MGMRNIIRTYVEGFKKPLLELLLKVIYFGVISSYALIWRLLLRRGLLKTRSSWTHIAESTDTPNLFTRTV